MRRWAFASASCVLALIGIASLRASDRQGGRTTLAPAEIEKVTGLKNVHVVTPPAPGTVPGRENYADGSGKVVLWCQSFPAAGFAAAKAQPAKTMNGVVVEPKLFHATVRGLGDDAFDSPDGGVQHALYVRKGQLGFGLISNLTSANAPSVTMDQLKALAAMVLARQ